jgi:hypothetical protein
MQAVQSSHSSHHLLSHGTWWKEFAGSFGLCGTQSPSSEPDSGDSGTNRSQRQIVCHLAYCAQVLKPELSEERLYRLLNLRWAVVAKGQPVRGSLFPRHLRSCASVVQI